ncbi:MAG: DUF1570 domain-containing protein [Planctomycetes bacterium]|nr:DUF1570 domain-containing protein [Planctomycetota bacterium]
MRAVAAPLGVTVAVGFSFVLLARADVLKYVDEEKQSVEVEGRVVGSGRHLLLIQLDDGQIRLVPDVAVTQHEKGPGPEPIDCASMLERLQDEFGGETFRGYADPPFVIGLVLAAPLPSGSEPRVAASLKRAARFLRNVQSVFGRFAKSLRLPLTEPQFPMVLLIFETGDRFCDYTKRTTRGQGLSAAHMAGFYSITTNRLAIRLSECVTFDTPLHEAIHQQVYNRGIFQRVAPIPAWFNEGLATGFEGNGEKITTSPARINVRQARRALEGASFTWKDLLSNDDLFRDQQTAADAYAQAWGLHWLLATRYRRRYAKYVRLLSAKKPLQEDTPEQRLSDFEGAIGLTVEELQAEFRRALAAGLRRQRVRTQSRNEPGVLLVQSDLAKVRMIGVARDGIVQAQGQLRNLSTIRPMSFYVMAITDAGTYAEWYVSSLDVNRVAPLPAKPAAQRLPGALGGAASTFQIRVWSAIPGSETDRGWRRGQRPSLQPAKPESE